jgi:two-component system response regulator RegA
VDMVTTEVAEPMQRESIPEERTLLIVEDDRSFLQRLAKALEQRGFAVAIAESVADGLLHVERAAPAFAIVDMRLGDGNGLDVISALKRRRPEARGIILTGYGNIATAVNAVKLGAVDYLAKPVDADDVVAALLAQDNAKIEPPENPMSADRVRCSGFWPSAHRGKPETPSPRRRGPSNPASNFRKDSEYWIARLRGRWPFEDA